MVDILNWRLRKQSYSEIAVGIGLSWGQALMVKAGYKNSGINNIVYMGTVVNEAAKLCSYGNREYLAKELHLSDDFYGNLNAENQKLCTRDYNKACYSSNIVNTAMDKWLTEQQKV